ncbi:lactosylceramide 1,3-N-acetyl-beta-D-glucosaminyltransferase-like [Physella acuta]|uniref:lactosylceramide 1,3-N-acetyl-beta-D-glucosaminyltransferase-like n=1 Tax=Physella acuta TaxID=109671 RepID=UPI0027DB2658|nr:lactosylceramide 1,3-N-acetyl-beta-D-glucosaminyltransferase-like [Physella acuta]
MTRPVVQRAIHRRGLLLLLSLVITAHLGYLTAHLFFTLMNSIDTLSTISLQQQRSLQSFELAVQRLINYTEKYSSGAEDLQFRSYENKNLDLFLADGGNKMIRRDLNHHEDVYFSKADLFKNITKTSDGDKLFEYIQDEEYLASNSDYFTENKNINNNFDFPYLINGENICQGQPPYLLLVIPSVVKDVLRREAIRKTWLHAAETNKWPWARIHKKIKHVFLFGHLKVSKEKDIKQIQFESNAYGDVVMADFEDSYRNLTLKILLGFRWAVKLCQGAQFLVKVDIDTLINVPLMLEFLDQVKVSVKNDKFLVGLKHFNSKPEVVRFGMWSVNRNEYPLPYYPQYMYGHAYAMSMAAVRVLTSAASRVRWIAPEDAFITGVLAKTAGLARLWAPCFTVCCRDTYDCELVWNQNVAITSVTSTTVLLKLWAGVTSHRCNDKVPMYSPFL